MEFSVNDLITIHLLVAILCSAVWVDYVILK